MLDKQKLMRRRSGVDNAAELRPHDHALWFGDGSTELYAMASDALAEGARRNEKLIFIAAKPDGSKLSGIDVDRLLADGQLELLEVDAVYGGGTTFSAAAQLAAFQRVLGDALVDGYSGIRVVADNTTLAQGDEESFARWLAWEHLTDQFQAASMVTGICCFDRSAISAARQADLTALHPMRVSAEAGELALFADRDAVILIGSLGADCTDNLRRLLATVDFERDPIFDLSAAHLRDDEALRVLAAFASADRPLRLLGNEHLRMRVSTLGATADCLHVEDADRPAYRCAACGDLIGAYERAAIVIAGATHTASPAAEPEMVGEAVARYHRSCYAELGVAPAS